MSSERERAYQREYMRRYRAEHADELRAYKRDWARTQRRLETPYVERQRAYGREYQRTKRLRRKAEAMASASFTLHDLSCPYPNAGCECRALVVTA